MQGNSIFSYLKTKKFYLSLFSSRKRALAHIARASERYFSDDPKVIAEVEELELEYLFKYVEKDYVTKIPLINILRFSSYIRYLKTFPKYVNMTEDEILQEVESDPHTLRQRTKEILKGKMSDSYAAYIAKYPIK